MRKIDETEIININITSLKLVYMTNNVYFISHQTIKTIFNI